MTTGNGRPARGLPRNIRRPPPAQRIKRTPEVEKLREALSREDITAEELAAASGRPLAWAENILKVRNRPALKAARRRRAELIAQREAQRAEVAEAAGRAAVEGMFRATGNPRRPSR